MAKSLSQLVAQDVKKRRRGFDATITDICYDSRKATPGSLFVAIPGAGLDFTADAIKRGAGIIVTDPDESRARETLAELSAAFFDYPAYSLKLIGVTGTNGKSTVTSLSKQVYEAVTGEKTGLIGSVVNLIGDAEYPSVNTTPESRDLHEMLAKMRDAGCTVAFIEVSSHALELRRVHGLLFDVGVITNLSQDHLDFHNNMDNYLQAKLRLAEVSKRFIIDGRIKTPSHIKGTKVDGSDNEAIILAVCEALDLPIDRCKAALAHARLPKGRHEIVPTPGKDYTVIIDYAVTPGAFEYILKTVRREYPGRKITMLFGCGGDRDKKKRPIMGEIAARLADKLIITSDNSRSEDPEVIINDITTGVKSAGAGVFVAITDRIKAITYALESAESGEVIILCGKGHELYQITAKGKIHMDEREIVASILRS